MKNVDRTIKVITHIAKESDKFNSEMFSEEEGIIFGISCLTKLLGDIAISLAVLADAAGNPEDQTTQQHNDCDEAD